MDKETLSNYGWIVVLVLILAVLLALATPFGNFIAGAIKSTTQGLFDVNQGALNAAGIEIMGQEFEDASSEENSFSYRFMNHIDQGDYRYLYYGCNDEEEFGFGYLKFTLLEEGIVCSTDEEVLENAAQLLFGCSWTDMQAQGYTPIKLFDEMEVVEVYNEIKTEGVFHNGWWVQAIDNAKTEYASIPEQINGIPVTWMYGTFCDCTSLTTAPEIPSSVTNMNYTFYGCESLTTAPTIPSSVTNMERTFQSCTSLTAAPEIPSGVTEMKYTFAYCKSLTSAPEIPSNVTNMYGTFQGCTSLTTAPEIPSSVTNMYETFYGCKSLTTAPTIPSSVTNMTYTFYYCTSLTTAPEIPSSVTDMSATFSGCTSLTGEISIPCSLASKNYTYTDCPATVTYYHVDGCDGSCGK